MSAPETPLNRTPADALQDLTVLLIEGSNASTLARAALATARATAPSRRVAVFDLAGAFHAERGEGLVAALREGRSLNSLARPLDEGAQEWFVVGRGPEQPDVAVATHERWPKLMAGFRSAGALLVILVPRNLPGGAWLMELADRAVSIPPDAADEAPPGEPEKADRPETAEEDTLDDLSLPPVVLTHRNEPARAPTPKSRLPLLVTVLIVVSAIGLWPRVEHLLPTRATPDTEAIADAAAREALVRTGTGGVPGTIPDTLPLPVVVNPQDSARAAAWGVELVATNDRADANFRLAAAGPALSSATISPVLMGTDPTPLFKVVGGAFADRAEAERLRDDLRARRVLAPETGVVARVPYAIRLGAAMSPATARVRAREWTARGTAAYALLDEDGRAAVYAGAFSSPDHAVLLLAALRDETADAALAFRVGRSF